MAVANGFGKVVTSGSVFMYDTGDTVNSYRGEPTINYVNTHNSWDPLDLYTWASSGNTSTWSRDPSALLSPVKGIPLKEVSSGTDSYSATYYGTYWNLAAASSGQTWTVSVYAKAAAGTNLQIWIFGANSSGAYVELDAWSFTATGDWQRISGTRTLTSGATVAVQSRVATATNGATVWWDGLQMEQNSHITPFTIGTRSSTQGLLPIVGNSTINLSTVSFDSNAQIIFDGTDDTIDTGIPLTDLPALSNFSIECIVKIDSYPSSTPPNGYGATYRCGVLVGATYYCGTALYWYGNSSGTVCNIYAYIRGADSYRTAGEYNLTPGRYHHLILTNDYTNGSINLYANGILNGSAATATQEYNSGLTPTAGNIGISKAQVDGGGTAVYSNFLGQLPITKIYKRALSAAEVRQNYNKYKSRFNLS